ncbi:MAG: TrmH family RNA methyltransferase [Patescibacteria group bacterium]
MTDLVLIAHNLRSSHNVGSLLRTAEGLGVKKVYLTGYTPYPISNDDIRLPHLAQKINNQIAKTALGAEKSLTWQHSQNVEAILDKLRQDGYMVTALEQAANSVHLPDFSPPNKLALIVGREVEGIEPEILEICDKIIEIPMFGAKESFNVVQAAAMALYHLRFGA